jgi:putative nucleotidyltransferase with HDIG domain
MNRPDPGRILIMWRPWPIKNRRRNGRKPKPDRSAGWVERFRAGGGGWPLLISVLFFALATLAVVWGQAGRRYRLGQYVSQPIPARVAFDWVDEDLAAAQSEYERRNTENYYRLNVALFKRLQEGFEQLKNLATQAEDLEHLRALAKETSWQLDDAALQWMQSYGWLDRPIRLTLSRITDGEIRLINPPTQKDRSPPSQAEKAILLPQPDDPNVTRPVLRSELLDVNKEAARKKAAAQLCELFPEVLHAAVQDFVAGLIQPDPALKEFNALFVFDAQRTAETIEANVARARERAVKRFEPKEVIVEPGVIDEKDMALILLEAASYDRFLNSHDPAAVTLRRERWRSRGGVAGLVALATVGLMIFTRRTQPRVVRNPMRCATLALLILMTIWLARLLDVTVKYDEAAIGLLLIPAAVLTIAYTQRFAVGICATACVLAALVLRADLGLFLTLLAPVIVAILLLRRVTNRWQLVKVALASTVTALLASLSIGAMEQTEERLWLWYAGIAGISALLGGFMIQVVIPVVEWAFKIATPLTLLEWSNTSNPLLRRMAIEAPGTLQHSDQVGRIAEDAAEAIGADGLLVRVGALYHDIGKMNKPQFFVENQESPYSRHAKLQSHDHYRPRQGRPGAGQGVRAAVGAAPLHC